VKLNPIIYYSIMHTYNIAYTIMLEIYLFLNMPLVATGPSSL